MLKLKIITILIGCLLFSCVYGQKELIGPIPEDQGKQGRWKEPNLLPEKYAKNLKYHAITYGREGLIPLPSTSFGYKIYDWNEDGFDDIVGCNYPFHHGVPYIIVYLSSGGEDPTFTSPRESQIIIEEARLGRFFDFMDVDGDGKDEVITFEPKSRKILAFRNTGTKENPKWEDLQIKDTGGETWAHIQDVLKEPPFTVTDWDGDGRKDLIVGTNHPSVMKHSYGTDPDIMNPEAYRVYFVKNVGKAGETVFGMPQVITVNGEPVTYSGFAYPLAHDIDGDGKPDLVSGEHRPGVKVFKNITKDQPRVEYIGNLQDEYGNELTDIIYFHLEIGDINGDGVKEFVSTTQFSGTTYYHPIYTTDNPLQWKTKESLKMMGDADSPVYGPAICTVEPMDWDDDGDADLLLGAEPGMPMLLENTGSDANPVYANPESIRFYDGTPVRTFSVELGDGSSHGAWEFYDDRSAPTIADWDGDGIKDLVSSTQGRRMYWMKGKIVENELRFSPPQKFLLNRSELLHPHRCKPGVHDWNGDGNMDLIALNTVSEIVIYLGNKDSNLSFTKMLYPVTTRNDAVVSDLSIVEPPLHVSLAGRTGIEIFDWDNDGHMDIITHKHRGTVLYYRNTGKGEATFEPARVMFDFDSHLAGPAVMDYNLDGYPDIVLGGDRKRYVGEKKLYPKPIRAQLMWYDGRSLPFPSKKR